MTNELKERLKQEILDCNGFYELDKMIDHIEKVIDKECFERPRFEDGEPVQFGDIFQDSMFGEKKIDEVVFAPNIYKIRSDCTETSQKKTTLLKYPTPKLKKPAWATQEPSIIKCENNNWEISLKDKDTNLQVFASTKEEAIKLFNERFYENG